jgi:hypothetical protein
VIAAYEGKPVCMYVGVYVGVYVCMLVYVEMRWRGVGSIAGV